MSQTTLASPVPVPTITDRAIFLATGAVNLAERAETANPALAAALQEKGAVFSKTNIGSVLVFGIPIAAAHYGLNLDAEAQSILIGVLGMAYVVIMSFFRSAQITSWFGPKKVIGTEAPAKLP